MTREDETGTSRVIISPDFYDKNRMAVLNERFVLSFGRSVTSQLNMRNSFKTRPKRAANFDRRFERSFLFSAPDARRRFLPGPGKDSGSANRQPVTVRNV